AVADVAARRRHHLRRCCLHHHRLLLHCAGDHQEDDEGGKGKGEGERGLASGLLTRGARVRVWTLTRSDPHEPSASHFLSHSFSPSRPRLLQQPSSSLQHQALVPIANGSAEMETIVVVDILRRAHVDVIVASIERSKQIVACRGTKIIADKLIGDAAESTYDLIILPGGCNRGERLHKSRVLNKLLQEQDSAGKVYGEICSSTVVVLEKRGLFKQDRMVSEQQSMTGNFTGQVAEGAGVVIDGNLITGSGPGNAINFSLAIVGKLFGHARARSVAEGIVSEYSECQVNST
ncbi:DJ-1-like protein C, partial [Nymphaea thermarum]